MYRSVLLKTRIGLLVKSVSTFARSLSFSRLSRATEGSVQAFIPPTSKPLGQTNTLENNVKSDTNRLSKTLTKFWEKVDTVYNEERNHYELQLDNKTLKTPLGFPIALPAEKKQLALLLEHEWSTLPDLKIKMNLLPLSSLTCRVLDLHNIHINNIDDPEMIVKVGSLEDIKLNLLRYADTDTCLIFTTSDEYEGKLRARQDELYLPLISEFEDYFTKYAHSQGGLLPHSDSKVKFRSLDCETDGLRGNQQDILTQNVCLHWMNNLSMYELVALEKTILTTKSFLCGASILRSNCSNQHRMNTLFQLNKAHQSSHFYKSIDEIVELGNLETIFQTERWGEVEDTHDVDKVDWLRNLASAAIVAH